MALRSGTPPRHHDAMDVDVRPARPGDPVPELLYLSAAPYYAAFAGGAGHARALLTRLYPHSGHTASWEVCRVAVVGGDVGGRARRLPGRPRRRARAALRAHDADAHAALAPARVDAPPAGHRGDRAEPAAGRPLHRRTGHAPATSGAAASPPRCSARPTGWPRAPGLPAVALDTGIENRAARALYERSGFTGRGLRPAPSDRIARAVGGSGFVGYVRERPAARTVR